MKKNFLRVSEFAFVVALIFSLFIGCGSAASIDNAAAKGNQPADSSGAAISQEPVKLTQFYSEDPDIDTLCGGDPNKAPWAIEVQKRTGVTLEYITSTAQEAADKFKLLLASGSQPDLFSCVLSVDYPGGQTKAISDGVVALVNPYLDTICRDYKKQLESNPLYMKNAKDDEGNIVGFAVLRSPQSMIYGGPMIRQDLLQKAGIANLPVTIEDWHNALKAFKALGYTAPLTTQFHWKLEEGGFTGAYGVTGGFSIGTDDKIHATFIEDGYRQFLTTFAQWYKEGLIDPDFFTVADPAVFAAKMTDMKTSAAGLANVSRIQMTNSAGKKIDPGYNVVGCRYPVLNAGDQPLYGQEDYPVDMRWFVSGKCKNIESAMRYYDYFFTDEGIALSNWGIKGLTYTEADGKKQYTPEIPLGDATVNSKGWSLDQTKKMYLPIGTDSFGVEDGNSFIALKMTYPGQADAIKLWSNKKLIYQIPPSLSYTDTESSVMKMQQNLTENVVRGWRMKFVMGNVALTDENWQKYVNECNSMGAEAITAVLNAAYDRYKMR